VKVINNVLVTAANVNLFESCPWPKNVSV